MLPQILKHLEALVSFDTTNPPRKLSASSPIIDYLATALMAASFELVIDDFGDGSVNLLATRGEPLILFNNHLDTVPANAHWTTNPHCLQIKDNRAIGLGACDIKGAAAALLTALQSTAEAPAAVIFTTDEEAGTSRCVRSFIEQNHDLFRAVFVAEPTECKAVLAHRGLIAAQVEFGGTSAHASQNASNKSSAVHRAVQWSTNALQLMREHMSANGHDSSDDLRFNIGRIEGGTKANVVAASATVVFGFRPRPDDDIEAIIGALQQMAAFESTDAWRTRFQAPALRESSEARYIAESFNLPIGDPVDFWTEAALFAQAGLSAIVFGPGNIAQAHSADEWAALNQLKSAANAYKRIILTQAHHGQPQQQQQPHNTSKEDHHARLL